MRRTPLLVAAIAALALAGGGAVAGPVGGTPVALVTAETQNELIAVSFPDGHVLRRIALPEDPQNVVANQRVIVVVSPRSGAVSLLGARSLGVTKVLRGFGSPHMAALAPSGKWAYVTDDGRGLLDVISLQRKHVVTRLAVGLGAHHMALSPNGRRLWIALGEKARTIVIVDVSRPWHPRVLNHVDAGFLAHDLAFSPDGRRVWVTSSSTSRVAVLAAPSGRRLFSVPAGPPPQHVAFGWGTRNRNGYVTSGYGSRIEAVDTRTGRVLHAARVPYGSFNVAALGDYVVTSSLMRGIVTELDSSLRTVRSVTVAPAARGVATLIW